MQIVYQETYPLTIDPLIIWPFDPSKPLWRCCADVFYVIVQQKLLPASGCFLLALCLSNYCCYLISSFLPPSQTKDPHWQGFLSVVFKPLKPAAVAARCLHRRLSQSPPEDCSVGNKNSAAQSESTYDPTGLQQAHRLLTSTTTKETTIKMTIKYYQLSSWDLAWTKAKSYSR